MTPSWDAYERNARAFADEYEALTFEAIHGPVMGFLPPPPAAVLDIGAGSGRDARWLSERGYAVVAVEPSEAMRREAAARHAELRVRWVGDALPDLPALGDATFDLVLLSGVWMHVAPGDRTGAFRRVAGLLAPGGKLILSLRQGPVPQGRIFHPVPAGELEALAAARGLRAVLEVTAEDVLGRSGVSWRTLVLQRPEAPGGAG